MENNFEHIKRDRCVLLLEEKVYGILKPSEEKTIEDLIAEVAVRTLDGCYNATVESSYYLKHNQMYMVDVLIKCHEEDYNLEFTLQESDIYK